MKTRRQKNSGFPGKSSQKTAITGVIIVSLLAFLVQKDVSLPLWVIGGAGIDVD